MKLSHLYESDQEDHRSLIRELAKELGFQDPAFFQLTDESDAHYHDVNADVNVGIELFKQHMDTEGAAHINDKLSAIISEIKDYDQVRALDYLGVLEKGPLGSLRGVKETHAAFTTLATSQDHLIASAKVCQKVYQLLSAFNNAATTTHSSQRDDETVQWRAAIAKAGLLKMGITPKAF
jgi:hypothetical protein